MDKLKEKIAQELAYQALRDEELPTRADTWAWVVGNKFIDEWLDKADGILALIKEAGWKSPSSEVKNND